MREGVCACVGGMIWHNRFRIPKEITHHEFYKKTTIWLIKGGGGLLSSVKYKEYSSIF